MLYFSLFGAMLAALMPTVAATCTPEQRIHGLMLAINATITGNLQTNAMVPFAPNATASVFVQTPADAIPIAVDAAGAHAAIEAFHLITYDIYNLKYTDNGIDTATVTGIARFGLPGVVGLVDVPAINNLTYTSDTCLGYNCVAGLYPLGASLILAFNNYFEGLRVR